MTRKQLFELIRMKESFLCVGLDTDPEKIPSHLLKKEDPVFEFNKAIIEATIDMAVAYKPNIAFYESRGVDGWQSLLKTMEYLKRYREQVFVIADAKRGDIGNTSARYAEGFFVGMDFDAITVAPYMGKDSVTPFLDFEGRWTILLALTSNPGAADFQMTDSGEPLFEKVINTAMTWGSPDNTMFVVGATKAEMFYRVRQLVPYHFLLVPGVGAQGGSLAEVSRNGMNKQCGLLVNSSRAILYAGMDLNYAGAAREAARETQIEMASLLRVQGII